MRFMFQEFYENYPELCDPSGYIQMADPKFTSQEKGFHKKAKSWSSGAFTSRKRFDGLSRLKM